MRFNRKLLTLLCSPTCLSTSLPVINLYNVPICQEGFNSGADDYIKKPFNPEALVIRIKSRYMQCNMLHYKDLSYNLVTKELAQDGTTVGLSDVLRNIFHELIIQKDKIVPSELFFDLLEHPNPNALRVNLSKLKIKLDLDIQNVRGIGYILEEL